MRISVAKIGILGIALCLGGCFCAKATAPCLQISETDLNIDVQRALVSASFTSGDFPAPCWWEMFQDGQLANLIERGLSDNPDIKRAQYRINLAYETALESRSKLLPHFDLFTSFIRQKESLYDIGVPDFLPLIEGDNLFFNTATMFVTGFYELDVWSKNRNKYYADLGSLKAAEAEKARVELLLSSLIAKAYFALQTHLIQQELLKKQYEAKEQAYLLLKERYFRGLSDEFFVYIFSKEVAEIQNDLAAIEGTVEVDVHALAALVGGSVERDLIQPLTAKYQSKIALPTTLPLDLLVRRPDIQTALWMIQSKGSEVKVAKARFFPSFDLLGFIGSSSYFVSRFFTYPSLKIWGEAFSVLPLYTAGELQAKLGQSQAILDITVEEYNQTVLLAVQQVCDAMSLVKAADVQMGKVKEAVADSKALYDLTSLKYSHGIDTNIRVCNALSNLYVQQLLESEVQLKRMVAIVDLIYSLGGGYGCS